VSWCEGKGMDPFIKDCKFNGENGVLVFRECVSCASVEDLDREQPRFAVELRCHADMSGRVLELLASSLPYKFSD
jgi:hypothetical protein